MSDLKIVYCHLCGREMIHSDHIGCYYCICSKEATLTDDQAEELFQVKHKRRRRRTAKNSPKKSRKKA